MLHQIFGALEAFGQLFADGLLDDARPGKADQRAGLGDVDVAEHGIGGGDAAGGRVGQHDDVGQAGFLQPVDRHRGARQLHQRQDAFLHARAAGGGEQHQRPLLVEAVSKAWTIASPAAMPSEPPMKAKSCTDGDDRQALDRAQRR